ncbi:MAG TPA: cytochrome P450 [Acidimicrobiaceae bacterium]|nr:cytochrome P450 [Acidimicrobiaceae bacterium]|tara:strand:+ start:4617 stop:5876 length:1260 start_codon:yes stop_codon:yes gene_type:complete
MNRASDPIKAPHGSLNKPSWNPFDPDFMVDPYPTYAHLRDEDPVHRNALGVLIASRYDDVHQVLRDPHTSVRRFETSEDLPAHMKELRNRGEDRPPSILGLDPPDHTRLRKLVQRTFTPRSVARMRERTVSIVDDLLNELAIRSDRGIDLIADYAFVIPFAVIHDMLGLPEADIVRVRAWSHALTQTLEPYLSPEQVDAAIKGGENMEAYLRDAIAWKRREPAEDLLTDLVQVEEEGDRMSEEELLSMTSLLFVAGHETTVNLIGNGTYALLRHPDQLELVCTDSSVDQTIADELLRYDSPVQTSGRRMMHNVEIAGVEVPAGEMVLTALGSANRDPRFWGDDADELIVTRADANRHVSFGSGVHHCLGAALARMEGEIAVTRLVRRFPDLALAGEPTYNARIILRGHEVLPIDLGRAA